MKQLVIFLLLTFVLHGNAQFPSLSEESCETRTALLLESHENTIVIHIKGMVCSSCGIGVNFTLNRLDFVDNSRFERGVLLDARNQFAIVAYNSIEEIDAKKIRQAIINAGYDPLHYYYKVDGKIKKVIL
tara:strand:- start:1007 stop:1396 length:390 start_codon:yes stop_codon:yes gene_type:complete